MWGCFFPVFVWRGGLAVFPTHVGVFHERALEHAHHDRLPHACGGVSIPALAAGCGSSVFPTHVGVFPSLLRSPQGPRGLPHACGGVSIRGNHVALVEESSPRMWGCFSSAFTRVSPNAVFPTHVGVFLQARFGYDGKIRLPHACGGVSRILYRLFGRSVSSPRMWGCFFLG